MSPALISIVGLTFDLVGAFLLSIPLVWNLRRAARALLRALFVVRTILFGKITYRRNLTHRETIAQTRIAATMGVFALGFFLIFVRLVVIYAADEGEVVTFFFMGWRGFPALVIYMTLFFSFLWLINLVFYFPFLAANILLYIARKRLERVVGVVGLLVLFLGFLLQALVNYLVLSS